MPKEKAKCLVCLILAFLIVAWVSQSLFAQVRFSEISVPVAADARALSVADVNGDCIPDVIVSGNVIQVFKGRPDGTLAAPYTIPYSASKVAVADLDGDNLPDLAFAAGGAVMVLFGEGDDRFRLVGNYRPPELQGITNLAAEVVVADVNGDGWPDVVSLNVTPHSEAFYRADLMSVSTLISDGFGGFNWTVSQLILYGIPVKVEVSDFNRDGRADLVVSQKNPDNLLGRAHVLLGQLDGTFLIRGLSISDDLANPMLAVGDFNGDGIPDIVLNSQAPITSERTWTQIFLGWGDGTFHVAPRFIRHYEDVVAGDFKGDGFDEAVGYSSGLDSFVFVSYRSDGSFLPRQEYNVHNNQLTNLAVADMNGDGQPDIVARDGLRNRVMVYLNTTQP